MTSSWFVKSTLPDGWHALPVKRLGRVLNGGTPASDPENWGGPFPFVTPPDLNGADGEIVATTGRTLTKKGTSAAGLAPADSVLVSTRAPIGHVGRISTLSAFNQGCRAVSPQEGVEPRYLALALVAARAELKAQGQGTTFIELSSPAFASIPIPVPTLNEQRAIADYLDDETAQIDALVAKQEEFIRLLQERRRAAIRAAIAQLGGAPVRLGLVASSRSGDVPPRDTSDGPVEIWGAGRLIGHTQRANAHSGDILVGRVGAGSVGKVNRLTVDTWASDNTVIVKLNKQLVDPRFVEHYLRSIPRHELVGGGAMPLLTAERLLAQRIPLPELASQVEALDQLEEVTARIDALITKTEEHVSLAKERHSALITAAVTGQIDVRTTRKAS